jgi:hypothetical protein
VEESSVTEENLDSANVVLDFAKLVAYNVTDVAIDIAYYTYYPVTLEYAQRLLEQI